MIDEAAPAAYEANMIHISMIDISPDFSLSPWSISGIIDPETAAVILIRDNSTPSSFSALAEADEAAR
jgi:hypothetical protein